MSWILLAGSGAAFAALSWLAWAGRLGLPAILLLVVSAATFFLGRRGLSKAQRRPVETVAKVAFTIVGCMALLRHPIEVEGQGSLVYEVTPPTSTPSIPRPSSPSPSSPW